jgi:hypothetical protein
MDIKEFKILLKLLQKKDYESAPSGINPNDKTKTPETLKWCQQLSNRGFVQLTEEIDQIAITSTGKTLLKQENRPPALTEKEWQVLRFFHEVKVLKPSEINIKSLKATERNEIISKAIERGFLKVNKYKITRITLTETGQDFLATEYLPTGGNLTLSSKMLEFYLRFLRKYWRKNQGESLDLESLTNLPKPSDEEILQTIIDLDQELNTDNYLPIFHLRNKLQPPLTRDELDQALYRLQGQDKLSIDCLVKAGKYTTEEYNAGIPTNSAGPLFFITLNKEN